MLVSSREDPKEYSSRLEETIGVLQQFPRQVGAGTLVDFVLGGAL
jgi:hypothetical protein